MGLLDTKMMHRKLFGFKRGKVVYLPTSEVTSGVTGVGVCNREVGLCNRLSASCCRAVCTQEQQRSFCGANRHFAGQWIRQRQRDALKDSCLDNQHNRCLCAQKQLKYHSAVNTPREQPIAGAGSCRHQLPYCVDHPTLVPATEPKC